MNTIRIKHNGNMKLPNGSIHQDIFLINEKLAPVFNCLKISTSGHSVFRNERMRIKNGYINIKTEIRSGEMDNLTKFMGQEDYRYIVKNGLLDILTEGGQSTLYKDWTD